MKTQSEPIFLLGGPWPPQDYPKYDFLLRKSIWGRLGDQAGGKSVDGSGWDKKLAGCMAGWHGG